MRHSFNFKKRLPSLMVHSILAIGLLCISCQQTTQSSMESDTDLIAKINAVQEQIMAQGNITEDEEKAGSSS